MSRIVFAHQLRGVAVTSVVLSHLVGVYWAMPQVVAALTSTTAPTGEVAPVLFRWTIWRDWQPGPFGVALFFLISGLVIPISLKRVPAAGFLVARVFRIFPVAICGQLIGLVAVHALVPAHRQVAWPNAHLLLANLFLFYDWLGLPSLDMVNWSLCVELKFYVIAALCAPALRTGRSAVVLGLCAVCALAVFLASHALPAGALATMIGTDAVYLCFMWIGSLFYLHVSGRLSSLGLGAAVLLGAGATCAAWYVSPLAIYFPAATYSYLEALALFSILYGLRRFARPWAPLDRLADISYPIYMTHSVMGYAMLRCLTLRLGMNFYAALGITVCAILCVATLLHVGLEKPGVRLGHAIAARLCAGTWPWRNEQTREGKEHAIRPLQ